MSGFEERLRYRLERLEETLPTGETRGLDTQRKQVRLTLGAVSGIAAATLLAGVVAGAAVVSSRVQGQVQGHPGLFGPGGLFHCTLIEEMPPRRAAVALGELGYAVTWQVENRDDGSSEQTVDAPDDGYIIDGILRDDADLLLVVEQGDSAEPAARQSCER